MTNPLHDLTMLGFESASVIGKRLAKIGRGGTESVDEVRLMFTEKRDAAIETILTLMFGGTPAGTVARLRAYVAANEERLSA